MLVIVALLAIPPASSTWKAYGTYEPDTARDVADGYMQRDASPGDGKKLYFNAYPTEQTGVLGAGVNRNPNNALLGSRILVTPFRVYAAVLGNWVDCNQDGYLGLAESAVVVYRSELLSSAAVCPTGSIHNDGQWVWEYLPVGYNLDEVNQNQHPSQIPDIDAKVWGDFGLPGAGAAATCPIAPLPHGTTAGTGFAIRYADCFAGKQIAKTVNSVDSDGSLGLRFQDENHPESSTSLLNQHLPESLFGNPETQETGALQLDSEEDGGDEERAAEVWDCNGRTAEVHDDQDSETTVGRATVGTRRVIVDDRGITSADSGTVSGKYGKIDENFTDSDGNYAWAAAPAPDLNDPRWSWADTANHTFRGFHTGGNEDFDNSAWGGTCQETGNDQDGDNSYPGLTGTAFFYPDGPHQGNTQVAGKNKEDIPFFYSNGAAQDAAVGQTLGSRMPASAGLTNIHGWQSNTVWVTVPQSVNRADPLNIPGGAYATFYAKVGASTLAAGYKTTGTSANYGALSCGSFTSGIHGGWECAASEWNKDIGAAARHWYAVVGETYQFRDIDCDDGTVARGSGVHASLVDLSTSGAPCVDSPV